LTRRTDNFSRTYMFCLHWNKNGNTNCVKYRMR